MNIRAAKHSRGAEEDGDNWKFVGKISQGNDGKVTIQVNAAGMKEITSSDGRGTERWIPVLISVDGVTDIKEITWGTADQSAALGDGDVSDVNDMLDLEGNKPKDGEFVVWLDADATPSVDRVIKVGDKTKNLSFVFEQADIYPELTTEDLNNEELKKEFSALFAMFQNPAHLRTMHRLEGFEDETFTVNSTETTSNAISFKVTFNGYKFDSTDAYKVNGDATMTFSGSVSSDNSALEADKWNIISDKLTFASVSDSSTSYTAKAVDMSGSVVAGGAFGTTSAVFKFKLDDTGKYANDILDYPENDEESTAQTPCFGLSNFSEDSSAALVEINRTVTGALINKYIAMTSQEQSATFF